VNKHETAIRKMRLTMRHQMMRGVSYEEFADMISRYLNLKNDKKNNAKARKRWRFKMRKHRKKLGWVA
jgi:hypothetical protein